MALDAVQISALATSNKRRTLLGRYCQFFGQFLWRGRAAGLGQHPLRRADQRVDALDKSRGEPGPGGARLAASDATSDTKRSRQYGRSADHNKRKRRGAPSDSRRLEPRQPGSGFSNVEGGWNDQASIGRGRRYRHRLGRSVGAAGGDRGAAALVAFAIGGLSFIEASLICEIIGRKPGAGLRAADWSDTVKQGAWAS